VQTIVNRLSVLLQYLLPKQFLTELMGKLASKEAGRLTTGVIRWFIARYHVNMAEAEQSDPADYKTFQTFFTRPLKAGMRPLADAGYICPVDGTISQFGDIRQDRLIQAKGHDYTTVALLGGEREMAARYENGSFATLYLGPGDYHRIHMPCAGRLTRMIYIPGTLFSVNPVTALHVPGLFARNERLVCEFESAAGPYVLTFVGATVVGSIQTVWQGVVNSPRPDGVRQWRYENGTGPDFKQGDEIGRFLLGSTVVMLFPPKVLSFNPDWAPERKIRMGECMGQIVG
jgi:phosphatidylserine decarboxylase